MPLTLRPTGLRRSAVFAHLADYSVYDDGREVGLIYEVHSERECASHRNVLRLTSRPP
jgi:hypothetical protein